MLDCRCSFFCASDGTTEAIQSVVHVCADHKKNVHFTKLIRGDNNGCFLTMLRGLPYHSPVVRSDLSFRYCYFALPRLACRHSI